MILPEPLIFPDGVRFPRKEDIPVKDLERILRQLRSANITTGFIRHGGGKAFTGSFEANAHAPKIFALFKDLAESLLPSVAAPIIGLKDMDPLFGPYTTRKKALAIFEPYIHQLQHDGFLEFGIIFGHKGKVEEIFVKSSKYFKIWTNQPEIAESVFERHGIPPVPELQFIDQFPMVSESLGTGKDTAGWPEVYYSLEKIFKTLPEIAPGDISKLN